ncbi:hypothetical protein CsSME_00009420 [Camellia sinensis var. sinensis]
MAIRYTSWSVLLYLLLVMVISKALMELEP